VRTAAGPVVFHTFFEPRGLRHVLVDHPQRFTKRGVIDDLIPVLGNGLLTAEGAPWRGRRSELTPCRAAPSSSHRSTPCTATPISGRRPTDSTPTASSTSGSPAIRSSTSRSAPAHVGASVRRLLGWKRGCCWSVYSTAFAWSRWVTCHRRNR